MAQNAIDLCLASTVAGDLGISSDSTVERCVTAVSRAIATFCGRTLEKATGIIEYPPSFEGRRLLLKRAPILSITSIYERDALVDSGAYESVGDNAAAGVVYRNVGLWMSTQDGGGLVTETRGSADGRSGIYGVKVTYTAGYVTPGQNLLDGATYPTVTVPHDLQEAAILSAVSLYRSRGADQYVASESIGDWSVSYFASKAEAASVLPGIAQALLAPYKFIQVA